jgi:predicted RNase H-related nuclease YkuK (DUF458 family)
MITDINKYRKDKQNSILDCKQITVTNIDCDEVISYTATKYTGVCHEIIVEGLGEFKFIFSKKDIDKWDDCKEKIHLEVFWNPERYGVTDFIIGYFVDDIEEEMESIIEDMSYFIDGARISCECHLDDDTDNDGIYTGILESFFGYVCDEEEDV